MSAVSSGISEGDATALSTGPHPARRRGRPPGQQMRIAVEQLRLHHFSFVRAALEGIDLRKAWTLYLAFEGGPDDERHFQARLRDLQQHIRHGAHSRGMEVSANIAFGISSDNSVDVTPVAPSLPTPPSLDEWISQRCEATGIDEDFQSRAEWLEEYQAEFDLDRTPAAQWASAESDANSAHRLGDGTNSPVRGAEGRAPVGERLQALQRLAQALAVAPGLSDPLTAWLPRELAGRLKQAAIDSRPKPVVTVHDLIAFVNLHGHRWWRHVPRLGTRRGSRLLNWLHPLATSLGAPLSETALRPARRLDLTRLQPDARSGQDLSLVPLTHLTVPLSLDGRHGTFRTARPNTLGAETDLQAVRNWLRRFKDSPRTAASYERIVERFYLWCVRHHRKPLSSLVEADFLAYMDFLSDPPADWVQSRQTRRTERDWRPLKGPLAVNSRKLDFSVIGSLFSALVQSGYLTANALDGIRPSMKLPHLRINIERRLTDAQWRWILHCWDAQYAGCGPAGESKAEHVSFPSFERPDQDPARAAALRRTRLVLELGASTGLRLNELATTCMDALAQHVIDGSAVWLMTVRGKGGKLREVVVPADIKALIDQHHRDVLELSLARERVRTGDPVRGQTTLGHVSLHREAKFDRRPEARSASNERGGLPLINRLRRPPPLRSMDGRVVPNQDSHSTDIPAAGGSLDATALYQSLKRFFKRCALEARRQANALELAGIDAASTHWLRHFFASSAAADGVDLVVLRDALGHVSLQTTSVYVHSERKRLVAGMAQLRKRS